MSPEGRKARPLPEIARHAEPARVSDNLYFLGTKIHSAWALVGSDDYAAPDEIAGGTKKLGLDMNKVNRTWSFVLHSTLVTGALLAT